MPSNQKIASVVAALCEAFGRHPSKATFMAYEIGLKGITDDALDAAAVAVLQGNYKFMPPPGELRALALTDGQGIESRIDQAWVVFNAAIDRYGSGRSVNFHDALINATVRVLGGWERPCLMPREEFEKWYQRDFRATYARFMQAGPPKDTAGYLVGQRERENMKFEGVPMLYPADAERRLVRTKSYERPNPVDVAVPYTPLLESAPATEQIESRSEEVPRVEFQRA